jgi:hypothetical protein
MIMSRSSLDPIALLISGLLISVTAFSMLNFGNTTRPAAMQLFLYIGLGLILIAAIKFFIKNRKSIAKKEQKIAQQLAEPASDKPQVILCKVCRTRNYSTSNYCHICGARLR